MFLDDQIHAQIQELCIEILCLESAEDEKIKGLFKKHGQLVFDMCMAKMKHGLTATSTDADVKANLKRVVRLYDMGMEKVKNNADIPGWMKDIIFRTIRWKRQVIETPALYEVFKKLGVEIKPESE